MRKCPYCGSMKVRKIIPYRETVGIGTIELTHKCHGCECLFGKSASDKLKGASKISTDREDT